MEKLNDCYFYYYSTCNKGKRCPFRHCDSALGSEVVCEAWRIGRCFDLNCTFRHMEPQINRSLIPCWFETQPQGCRKPHCVFQHAKPRPSIVELQSAKSDLILPISLRSPYVLNNIAAVSQQQNSQQQSQARTISSKTADQQQTESSSSSSDNNNKIASKSGSINISIEREDDEDWDETANHLRIKPSESAAATNQKTVKTLEQIRIEKLLTHDPNCALDTSTENNKVVDKNRKPQFGRSSAGSFFSSSDGKKEKKEKSDTTKDFVIKTLDQIRQERERETRMMNKNHDNSHDDDNHENHAPNGAADHLHNSKRSIEEQCQSESIITGSKRVKIRRNRASSFTEISTTTGTKSSEDDDTNVHQSMNDKCDIRKSSSPNQQSKIENRKNDQNDAAIQAIDGDNDDGEEEEEAHVYFAQLIESDLMNNNNNINNNNNNNNINNNNNNNDNPEHSGLDLEDEELMRELNQVINS